MQNMSIEDFRQKLECSLVMYEDRPIFVNRIYDKNSFSFKDILETLEKESNFEYQKISPIQDRIGMVNFNFGAHYISRIPIRRYSLGLNSSNVNIEFLNSKYTTNKEDRFYLIRDNLNCSEIGFAIKGIYPSFQSARQVARQLKNPIAFDKQFAVDAEDNIFYKRFKVGSCKEGVIKFDENYQYLQLVLKV